ncbi:dlec1 deleted in lung and esophageal cancer 1 [Holotrichia oblita]|uniref:Dlec1 deleted in lung and esophageal cancer 1 n=1 Tax=Holotrichia oblita TaxID=644536 RepID=A0ACB9TFS0_HOLOL|nr:dlec1 deleted in lung and esophageal cancer 1 [Holotrichia oblita]
MEILLILMDIDRNIQNPVVPPSRYITEMTCSAEERLAKLTSITRKEKLRPEKTLNMLKAVPDIVVFQNYSLGDIQMIPISILNTYEISKPIRVILESTTVFSLTRHSGTISTKVAPGMTYQMGITFVAHEQKDYRHFVTVVSEGESFVIPIICISPRPLLDVPDRITLPPIPVKTITERVIIVRNIGQTSAYFNIYCSTGFIAEPERGCLHAKDYMQLMIKFRAAHVGAYQGRLTLTYETGERLTIMLEASTYESDIFLETNELESLDTYITLKRKRFVKLYNRSKHVINFVWKQFKSIEIDRIENLKCEEGFKEIKEMESQKYADLLHHGIIAGGDANEIIYERIYQDELREFRHSDNLLFTNPNWNICPLTGEVWPDNVCTFVITFAPTEAKYYETTVYLEVSGKEERLSLKLYGTGKGPYIEMNVYELDANDIFLCSKHQYEISIHNKGHPITVCLNLINTTQVPIEYVAKFPDDGVEPALSCMEYASSVDKPIIYAPKELTFEPEKHTVLPNYVSKGELTLLPNVPGEHRKHLLIIMWDTPKYSISLPIVFKCEVPDVICETQDIFMRGCFVNYVYTRSITIRCRNEHSGYFHILPYDIEGPTEIVFEAKPSEDFIEAYGVKEVEINIFTKHIGQSTLKVYISVFGGARKIYLCTIRCNGQGPVVTVPDILHFEEIRTLRTATQPLRIVNDSPVLAIVTVTHNKKSCCTISNDYITLNPSESLDLQVEAYVRVPGYFTDKIIFTTEQGESQCCLVKVTAVGSSILCEPEIEPELNLGAILTHQTFSLNIKFKNMSKKYHKIIWSRLKKLKSFRDDPSLYEGSTFVLRPNVFDLAPDQSIDCVLSGYATKIGRLEEDFYCHAILEGRRDYSIITMFLVIAEFVRPMLEMSHKELQFRIDNGVDHTTALLTDTVSVKNISKLDIVTSIKIEDPFFILLDTERTNMCEKLLKNNDVLDIKIEFVPKNKDRKCVVWNRELLFTYLDHPHKQAPWPTSLSEESTSITTISEPNIVSTFNIPSSTTDEYTHEEGSTLLNRRLEFDMTPPTIMVPEIIEPQPTEVAVISKVERTPEYENELQLLLYQLVKCYDDDCSEVEAIKCLTETQEQCRDCCEILGLVPTYGYLGPYEVQVASMEFSPHPDCIIKALAHCHPSGGKTETLSIAGKSSNIKFSVENNVIEFGRQIAYLPPYTLTIHGHGVIEQIFCSLPRPSLDSEMINFVSYKAIGSITTDLLRNVKSLTQLDIKWKENIPYNVREILKSDDWVIISLNDEYPTTTDIQMAIERSMVDLFISENYRVLHDHTILKTSSIISHNLMAPAYVMDFEHVVRDTEVNYVTTILNYGPEIANLRTIWARKLSTKLGFRAKLAKNCLQVGASTELFITFNPVAKTFPTENNTVTETIFILVSHGQKVPIEIKAHVTVPEITVHEKYINFNEVILGCCLRKDVALENTGFVPCSWEAKIEVEQKHPCKSAFFCKITSGTIEVGEKIFLDLYFEPLKNGKFKGSLIIDIFQNPNTVAVRLKGLGKKPMLKIPQSTIYFPSTLPYTENVEVIVTVENITTSPIEFYFPDFEEESLSEELIINTLMDYYKTNRIYIPYKKSGEPLHPKILQFYNNLLQSIRDNLNTAQGKSDSASEADGRITPPRRRLSAGSWISSKKVTSPGFVLKDPLATKSPDEILILLREQVRLLKYSMTPEMEIKPQDPVGEAITDALKKIPCSSLMDSKTGVAIIFHGSPYTDYVRAAYRAGLVLKLPVVSVDRMIYNALIQPATLAAIKVRQIIDEAFFGVASEIDLKTPADYDEYDFLQRKIDLLLSGKKKKPPKKSSAKEPKKDKKGSDKSSKQSGKGSKGKEKKEKGEKKKDKAKKGSAATESTKSSAKVKVDKRPTLIGISEELLFEIVQSQLVTFRKGVIIESLQSNIIKKPTTLLNMLLRGLGNIQYIHCIILSFTYNDYLAQKEMEMHQSKLKAIEDKFNKIDEILDMNDENYRQLSTEDMQLFKQEVLLSRKLNSLRKHEELLQRIVHKKKRTGRRKQKRSRAPTKASSKVAVVAKEAKKTKNSTSSKKNSSKSQKNSSKSSSKKSKASKSSKDSKKGKKGKEKKPKENGSSEEKEIKKIFVNSETLIWEILHTLEYWDRRLGILIKPVPLRMPTTQSSKKSKSTKSSVSSKTGNKSADVKKQDSKEEIFIKVHNPEEIEQATYEGIPCWLMENAQKESTLPERIALYLQHTTDLSEALYAIEASFAPPPTENSILLSVLHKPRKKYEKNISNVFYIADVNVTPPSKTPATGNDTLSSKTSRKKSARKNRSSLTSADKLSLLGSPTSRLSATKNFPKSKEQPSAELIKKLTSRVVINAGDKYTYKITFAPKTVGTYIHTFTIELAGWSTKYYIECNGICELPSFNFDPKVVFERAAPSKEHIDKFTPCTFFEDDKIFDFGTLLLPYGKDVKDKLMKVQTKLNLINSIFQSCETKILLTEDRTYPGVFSIDPTAFSVVPGESKEISIWSSPWLPGTFSGQVLVLIENNPQVFAFQLKASAIHVNVSFEPKVIEFERTTINNVIKKTTKLQNLSPVPIAWKAIECEGILANFKVHPLSGRIKAHEYQKIDFTFNPQVSGDIPKKQFKVISYDCILKISDPNSISGLRNEFSITITGEGYIPEISLIHPKPNPDESYSLIFPPLLVGDIFEKTVVFENTGVISCKVIAEICFDHKQTLSLAYSDYSNKDCLITDKLHSSTASSDCSQTVHHALISVEPHNKICLRVLFAPIDEVSEVALLKLHVVNNPYDVIDVEIKTESYQENIILTGLPTASFAEQTKNALIISRYELNLGHCTLNTLTTTRFTIKNTSTEFSYRFQFPSFDKLKFSPTIGHLQPESSKEVLVSFFTKTPLNLLKEIMQCPVSKIEYLDTDIEPLSWDDRQNIVIWKESSDTSLTEKRALSVGSRRLQKKSSSRLRKKSVDDVSSIKRSISAVRRASRKSSIMSATEIKKLKNEPSTISIKEKKVESKPEPQHKVIPETLRNIDLLLSVTADYCSYECSIRELTIDDTLMFEKRSVTFKVRNTSSMPLSLNWIITMDECFPRRINVADNTHEVGALKLVPDVLANIVKPTRLVKSAIQRPIYLSGNEFKVTFSPIDVFQYVVHLKAQILNLPPNNPGLNIVVNAKSLLPLYHFDILPSNYLSRRQIHQCGDIVDENTKVVEFDAVGLNIRHTRKFNVINPTGESFNFQWKPSSTDNNNVSLFYCNTHTGSVARGKMAESSFTFIPEQHGTFESLYVFTIEKYNIKALFLLTAVARNPCVFFSSSNVSLKSTLVNVEVAETIILENKEDLSLNFQFIKSSLFTNDRTKKIVVEPTHGTLAAKSKFPIRLEYDGGQDDNFSIVFKSKTIQPREIEKIPIYYHPKEVGNCVFTSQFFVNSKADDLILKGEGSPLLIELVDPEEKFINLGAILAGKQVTRTVQVINKSSTKVCAIFDIYERLPIQNKSQRIIEAEYEKEVEIEKKQSKLLKTS